MEYPLPMTLPHRPGYVIKNTYTRRRIGKKHQKPIGKIRFFAFGPHLGRKKLQDGRRWPEDGAKMAHKLAQDGRKLDPRWPKLASSCHQDGAEMALFLLLDRIFAPRRHKMAEDGHKMAPR